MVPIYIPATPGCAWTLARSKHVSFGAGTESAQNFSKDLADGTGVALNIIVAATQVRMEVG